MPGNRNDRRVKYTKMVIKESLLKLLKDRSIDKITVTDICNEADINRGTFYAHYSDPYHLLLQIEDDLFNDMSETLLSFSGQLGIHSTYDIILKLLKYICVYSDFCKILLGKYGDADFLQRIIMVAQGYFYEIWNVQNANITENQQEYIYAFIASGCVSVIKAWVEKGMDEPVEEVAMLLDKIVNGVGKAFF